LDSLGYARIDEFGKDPNKSQQTANALKEAAILAEGLVNEMTTPMEPQPPTSEDIQLWVEATQRKFPFVPSEAQITNLREYFGGLFESGINIPVKNLVRATLTPSDDQIELAKVTFRIEPSDTENLLQVFVWPELWEPDVTDIGVSAVNPVPLPPYDPYGDGVSFD